MGNERTESQGHLGKSVSATATDNLPRCWAEIDLGAIRANAQAATRASRCGVIGIIKANAYGLGAVEVGKALQATVEMFGVANVTEALELRKARIRTPILILGTCLPAERTLVIRNRFVPCISSLTEARAWNALNQQMDTPCLDVHVAVDTGMGRAGFPLGEWTPKTIRALRKLKNIRIDGLCSHFPSADEDPEFTLRQIQRFSEVSALGLSHGLNPAKVHLGNSAGALGFPELQEVSNFVRPGLMLYGVSPLPEMQHALRPVLSWKTRIILIRDLPKGHGVSYGRTFVTRKPTRVATLAVGYADGFPRNLSGQNASVLIRGQRCPILGRITMDQTMVDVTDLPAKEGDETVLIGKQGREQILISEVAQKAGTIPWEILTRLSARVQRFHKES